MQGGHFTLTTTLAKRIANVADKTMSKTVYWRLRCCAVRGSNPGEVKKFYLLLNIYIDSGAHSASSSMSTGVFSGGKATRV